MPLESGTIEPGITNAFDVSEVAAATLKRVKFFVYCGREFSINFVRNSVTYFSYSVENSFNVVIKIRY